MEADDEADDELESDALLEADALVRELEAQFLEQLQLATPSKPADPWWTEEEERITGVASGTANMLMPGERTMAEREKFETKGYDPSRDSIVDSVGATLASEESGLHDA